MNEAFKSAFEKLSIDDKRNQISDELILISELIKNIEYKLGVSSILNVKNYDINKQSSLSESEMLSFIYEDVYNIQRELITVLSAINIKIN